MSSRSFISSQTGPSLSEMVFGFLEYDDGEVFSGSINSDSTSGEDEMLFGEDQEGNTESNENGDQESKKFWEKQNELLQATLCRSNSLESRIRNATKEALNNIKRTGITCACGGRSPSSAEKDCRNCLLTEVSNRLGNAGLNAAVCKSKWKSSTNIPSGEHTFLDVIEASKRGDQVRVIIEVNFRAEFEMARASEEYNRLVKRLPEVFVGKVERLKNVIKIVCSAAKKCMREKKIHMGPWRKHRYMQAKWLGSCERTTVPLPLSVGYHAGRIPRPRAPSMLTLDLHRTAVEVS